MSPFRGQLSGKRLLASTQVSVDAEIKAQWSGERLFSRFKPVLSLLRDVG
jgi:hypothetical protein